MSEPVIAIGDKVHVITRRLFEGDVRRHFAGTVTAKTSDVQKVTGYAFIFNQATNEYTKLPELRTRLFALGEMGFVVIVLPSDVKLASLEYRVLDDKLCLTDDDRFTLDINEFGLWA